jgi:hypothetical protein
MTDDETKVHVYSMGNEKRMFLKNLSEWNKIAPYVVESLKDQEWLENSINNEPQILHNHTNETFREIIEEGLNTIPGLLNLPEPSINIIPLVSSSGSFPADIYYRYINEMVNIMPNDITVAEWSKETKDTYLELQQIKNTSRIVNSRLDKLGNKFVILHNDAIKYSNTSNAGLEDTIKAASAMRELIDQFKGYLIDKCRGGRGATYKRIAEFLGIDTSLTKLAIEGGQSSYDHIHNELDLIIHRRIEVKGYPIMLLLRELENHIKIITDAIDTNKFGINFFED